jgi:hypothetical protein
MRKLMCDLCQKAMFDEFSDEVYHVTVKRLSHAYDGYAPWTRRQKLDVCDKCMRGIVKEATRVRSLTKGTSEHITSKRASNETQQQ